MRTVEKWRWRIQWGGRWTTTRIPYTEEGIRREHPEAERVPGSMKLVEVPETDEEREAIVRSTLTSSNQVTEYHPDGTVKKMWQS
jgi:hypothetical protein